MWIFNAVDFNLLGNRMFTVGHLIDDARVPVSDVWHSWIIRSGRNLFQSKRIIFKSNWIMFHSTNKHNWIHLGHKHALLRRFSNEHGHREDQFASAYRHKIHHFLRFRSQMAPAGHHAYIGLFVTVDLQHSFSLNDASDHNRDR